MKIRKWISVDKKLPEENTDVLLKFEGNMAVGFLCDEDWYINTGNGMCAELLKDEDQPIAWMSLPEFDQTGRTPVVQNPTAHWTWVWLDDENRLGWSCSECGHVLSSRYIKCDYCPNCGRRCF